MLLEAVKEMVCGSPFRKLFEYPLFNFHHQSTQFPIPHPCCITETFTRLVLATALCQRQTCPFCCSFYVAGGKCWYSPAKHSTCLVLPRRTILSGLCCPCTRGIAFTFTQKFSEGTFLKGNAKEDILLLNNERARRKKSMRRVSQDALYKEIPREHVDTVGW